MEPALVSVADTVGTFTMIRVNNIHTDITLIKFIVCTPFLNEYKFLLNTE